jgi:pimeloyl-ACP methyl ester carboxylesterase
MATYVLVPGQFGGSWAWKFVVPYLREAGHEVFTVTLTGMGDRIHLAHPDIDLSTHVQDVANVLEYEDLSDAILVGWSYGAMVVVPVSHQVPERVRQVVILDADLIPEDGQSVYDIIPAFKAEDEPLLQAGNGWQIPPPPEEVFQNSISDPELRKWFVERLTPAPIKTQTTPAQLGNEAASRLPSTLIRCTWSTFWNDDHAARMLSDIRSRPNWEVLELEGPHIAPVTQPQETAAVLMQAAGPNS